jgi:hypothetical protein
MPLLAFGKPAGQLRQLTVLLRFAPLFPSRKKP